MTKPNLYQFVYSCSAEKARRFLRHKGVEWNTIEVDWFNRAPLEKVSKQRLVPILEDGNTVVGPSTSAVMDYVEKKYAGESLFPNGTEAMCHIIDEYVEKSLFPIGVAAFLPAAASVMKNENFDKDVVRLSNGKTPKQLWDELPQTAAAYEKHLRWWNDILSRQPYFLGAKMSAADHSIYSNYWFATNNPMFKELVGKMDVPHVKSWADRLAGFFFTKLPF